MAQALYRRWRPQTWDAVVGQDHVITTLRNAVRGDRVAHAYLFAGPRGTGKTTTARLLAKAVNCRAPNPGDRPCNECQPCLDVNAGRYLDLIEIDAASNTSVEDVRDLRERINFSPNNGRFKVYIVDEVHMLSTAAFNALLKTLEEPPGHAIFILATTEVHKIPATVLSRCQRHEFRRLPVAIILQVLQQRVEEESFEVSGEALELIARQATGSLRDAISLLDQLTSTGESVDLERAQAVLGTATHEAVLGVVEALIAADTGAGLTLLNDTMDAGADPRQLARQMVEYLRAVLLAQTGNQDLIEATDAERERMASHAAGLERRRLIIAIEAFSQAALEGRAIWQPKLPLELAFLESAADSSPPKPSEPADADAGSNSTNDTSHSASRAEAPQRKVTEAAPRAVAADRADRDGDQASAAGRSAKAPEPEAEAEGRPVPADGELSFQRVLDKWQAVLDHAYDRDPRCQALLNSGQPLGLEDEQLVLGFASDLLREKMMKGENMQVALASLQAALGESIQLRCVLRGEWDKTKRSQPPPVEDGGMVATAIRDLGARVAEVRPVEDDADG